MAGRAAIPLLTAVGLLAVAGSGHATQTWCAEVRRDVEDGFVNLRGGPSTSHPVLARLDAGEYVEIDTASCAEQFSADWAVTGTICAGTGSAWAFVEHVPRFGGRERGGWINTRHVVQVQCRDGD